MQAIIANTIGYIKIYVKNTHNSEFQPVLYCFSFHRLPSLDSLFIGKSTDLISNRQISCMENVRQSPIVSCSSLLFQIFDGLTESSGRLLRKSDSYFGSISALTPNSLHLA